MTKEELQLVWDTKLLDSWRKAYSIGYLVNKFIEETQCDPHEFGLLRIPPKYLNTKIGVRFFVASRLEKISNRMWEQSIERDALLIAKLQTSKYTTSNENTSTDYELQYERKRVKKNQAKVILETKNYYNRNKSTDWGTVK
jgi:hypothetical protein